MIQKKNILIVIGVLALLASCREYKPLQYDEFNHTAIVMCLGHNNLSSYMTTNLNDLEKGVLPIKNGDKSIVVYSHQTLNDAKSYNDGAVPVLYKVYRENGNVVRDTIAIYNNTLNSADADAIRTALNDIQRLCPSKSYGIIFSSHATAWLPYGYSTKNNNIFSYSIKKEDPYSKLPLTKTVGACFLGQDKEEMNIEDFVSAIPMHLDYFISDACLMSSVEVAWEFKDICDYFVASPTEVLAEGFVYKTLAWNIFSEDKPNILQIAKDYFNLYDSRTGINRSATISMIDCKKLPKLAEAFSNIVAGYTSEIKDFSSESVQKYFYNPNSLSFYFDLQDFAVKFGANPSQLKELNNALEEAIVYHAETPQFFGELLNLENCCGLSVYIPLKSRPDLTSYYPTLSWSKETGYLQ